MKKSIRLICLAMVILMSIAILGGCGASSSSTTDTASSVQAASTAATSTQATPAPAAPVKIVFAGAQADIPTNFPDVVKVADEFTKLNPNVTFEWQGAEHDEERKKIKMMAESNTLPDLFWESYNEMPPMAKMGVLADITNEVNADADWKASFKPGSLDNMTIDGKIYGVPQKNDAMGFFYNKAIFDKFSLKIPETWDEFKNAITVLNKNGITPMAQGTKDTWSVWGYNLFFHRYGYIEFHPDFLAGKAKFNNPNMVKAFGRLKEMADLKAFPSNITTVTYEQSKAMFLDGKAAIITTGTWELPLFEKSSIAKDIVFNWGPIFPDGIADQKIGLKEFTTGIWIGANAKKDADKWNAILAFLKFRSVPEGTKIIVEQANVLPATNYTGDINSVGPVFGMMINALSDSYKPSMQLAVMNESSFAQPIWNAMTGVMNGLLTPEKAADSMDEWFKNK